jgi:hypothetical protein
MLMATSEAVTRWREVFSNPGQPAGLSHQNRVSQYDLLWSYYANTVFEDVGKWSAYRSQFGLYRHTRSIYNPVQRVVDFYVNHVYPGVLSEDGLNLPDGVPLAIPLSEDTDPKLKDAIAQFWQWSNWQDGLSVMLTYGAATGNTLIEVIDEPERGKITTNVLWPGLIADLQLDSNGNVKGYALEYQAQDVKLFDGSHTGTSANRELYTYRKEVDEEAVRTFKNGNLFDYGPGAEIDNPYGFVPAVWVKHRNQGGDFGMAAVGGAIPKIDELNSLASHINDQVHKVINGTMVIATSGDVVPLFSGRNDRRAAQTDVDDFSNAGNAARTLNRESLPMLKAPQDTTVSPLAGDLNLADAELRVVSLLTEIERDFPELTFYQQLREMSQITGPAAARLTGDVGMKVQRAQANYDQQSIKLFQMAVAIGGWRLRRGDWQQPTDQQKKFAPFDLMSYERGLLDISILPRPLIQMNESEAIDIETKRATEVNLKAEFISEKQVLRELNYSDEEIAQIEKEKAAAPAPPPLATFKGVPPMVPAMDQPVQE